MDKDEKDSVDDPFSDFDDVGDDGEQLGDDEIDDWAALDSSDEEEFTEVGKSTTESSPGRNSGTSSKTSPGASEGAAVPSKDMEPIRKNSIPGAAPAESSAPKGSCTAAVKELGVDGGNKVDSGPAGEPISDAKTQATVTKAADSKAGDNQPAAAASGSTVGNDRSGKVSKFSTAQHVASQKDNDKADAKPAGAAPIPKATKAVTAVKAAAAPTTLRAAVADASKAADRAAVAAVTGAKVASVSHAAAAPPPAAAAAAAAAAAVDRPAAKPATKPPPKPSVDKGDGDVQMEVEVDEEKGQEQVAAGIPSMQETASGSKQSKEFEEYEDEDEYEDEEIEQGGQQQDAWGWSGGWGLGAIGNKLRQAAQVAVSDIRELTGSLHQALAEVEVDKEEEVSDGGVRDKETNELLSPRGGDDGELVAMVAGDGSTYVTVSEAPSVQSVSHREAITPGDNTGHDGWESHDEEEQALDNQVEQVAARALTNLGGMLSHMAKFAAGAPSNMPAGMSEDVHALQAAAARSLHKVAQLGSRLERNIESVGMRALGMLGGMATQFAGQARIEAEDHQDPATFEDFFYLYEGPSLCEELEDLSNESARSCNKARSAMEGEQQRELDDVLASLAAEFNAEISAAETQELVLEATCNKTGAAAAAAGLHAAAAASGGDRVSSSSSGEGALDHSASVEQMKWPSDAILQNRYAPIAYLCADSLARSERLRLMLQRALQRTVAAFKEGASGTAKHQQADGAAEAGRGDGDGGAATAAHTDLVPKPADRAKEGKTDTEEAEGRAVEGEKSGGGAAEAKEPASERTASANTDEFEVTEDAGDEKAGPLLAAIGKVRKDSSKRLAEVCAAQIEVLLDLGLSLVAPSDKPSKGGALQGTTPASGWPEQPEAQASLLKGQAYRMSADITAVAAAYRSAVEALLQDSEAAGSEGGAGEEKGDAASTACTLDDLPRSEVEPIAMLLSSLAREIEAVGGNACMKVMEGYRGLLYTILLRSIANSVNVGKDGGASGKKDAGGSEGRADARGTAEESGAGGAGGESGTGGADRESQARHTAGAVTDEASA